MSESQTTGLHQEGTLQIPAIGQAASSEASDVLAANPYPVSASLSAEEAVAPADHDEPLSRLADDEMGEDSASDSSRNQQMYEDMQARAAAAAAHAIGISPEAAKALSQSMPMLVMDASTEGAGLADFGSNDGATTVESETLEGILEEKSSYAAPAYGEVSSEPSGEQNFTCTVCRKVRWHTATTWHANQAWRPQSSACGRPARKGGYSPR